MENKYCSKCGKRLIVVVDEAQKYDQYISPFGSTKYNKFDSKTGEQQYVKFWKCPDERWWNSHSRYGAKLITKDK